MTSVSACPYPAEAFQPRRYRFLIAGLVMAASSKVTLTLERTQPATLSIDGHMDFPLVPGDRVELEQSPLKAKFLRANPRSHFYGTLTQRLGFGVEQARAVRF